MDVTSENFETLYPFIEEKIRSASFIAIDEEMTGITGNTSQRNRRDDNPDSRYAKMVSVASKFSVIQFGICTFHEVENGRFVASPFNFYLFAKSGVDITLSTDTMEFLRKNSMDFGKWMTKGLTFVNEEGEQYLFKKHMLPAEKTPQGNQIVLSKQSDIDFMKKNIDALEEMLASSTETEYTFDFSNAFLRKATYQYLDLEYPDLIVSKSQDNRVNVKKVSTVDRSAVEAAAIEHARKNYLNECGFRIVFKDLFESGKPIVGHNCMFDLMFMMRWFNAPLPLDLTAFKAQFNKLFPNVYDTKWVAASGVLGKSYDRTALSDLYDEMVLCKSGAEKIIDVIPFAEDFTSYKSGEHFHDAGWDSYCTGSIFAAQLHEMGGLENMRERAANRLFMMQSMYHMDLDPARPNGWIHVSDPLILLQFPQSTQNMDIYALFSQAGIPAGVYIHWIDGVSCYAQLTIGTAAAEDGTNQITAITAESVLQRLQLPEGWSGKDMKESPVAAVAEPTTPTSEDTGSALSPKPSALMDVLVGPMDWLMRTLSGGSTASLASTEPTVESNQLVQTEAEDLRSGVVDEGTEGGSVVTEAGSEPSRRSAKSPRLSIMEMLFGANSSSTDTAVEAPAKRKLDEIAEAKTEADTVGVNSIRLNRMALLIFMSLKYFVSRAMFNTWRINTQKITHLLAIYLLY